MEIIYKNQLFKEKKEILNNIKKGAVFIYPTDTIYGIGCNAKNKKAVEKIRKIKQRDTKPFSVISPSKKWIKENCETKSKDIWLKTLPSAITFILKLKNKKVIANNVNQNLDTIGIRIPDHWFTRFLKSLKIPIVTTSVNITKQQYMTSLEDLNEEIKSQVDFMIYDGVHKSKPSKIIDLSKEKPRIIR